MIHTLFYLTTPAVLFPFSVATQALIVEFEVRSEDQVITFQMCFTLSGGTFLGILCEAAVHKS